MSLCALANIFSAVQLFISIHNLHNEES